LQQNVGAAFAEDNPYKVVNSTQGFHQLFRKSLGTNLTTETWISWSSRLAWNGGIAHRDRKQNKQRSIAHLSAILKAWHSTLCVGMCCQNPMIAFRITKLVR